MEQKLISAGILRADGADIDVQEGEEDNVGGGGMGVYNEIEVSDGEEASLILEERLGFDEVCVCVILLSGRRAFCSVVLLCVHVLSLFLTLRARVNNAEGSPC